jgi:hypothetical protein
MARPHGNRFHSVFSLRFWRGLPNPENGQDGQNGQTQPHAFDATPVSPGPTAGKWLRPKTHYQPRWGPLPRPRNVVGSSRRRRFRAGFENRKFRYAGARTRAGLRSRKQKDADQQTCRKCPEPQCAGRNDTGEVAKVLVLRDHLLRSIRHCSRPSAVAASRYGSTLILIRAQKKATADQFDLSKSRFDKPAKSLPGIPI